MIMSLFNFHQLIMTIKIYAKCLLVSIKNVARSNTPKSRGIDLFTNYVTNNTCLVFKIMLWQLIPNGFFRRAIFS